MKDKEITAFDQGYRLGFRAGQLEMHCRALAVTYRYEAIAAGMNIPIRRGHVSLEDYTVESNEEG